MSSRSVLRLPSVLSPRWFVVSIFFLTGFFLGCLSVYEWAVNDNPLFSAHKTHPENNPYRFINPLISVDTLERKTFLESKPLERRILRLVENYKQAHKINAASVYFRDIEPGRWIGVNEEQLFSPGRLLKIPIMIAYLKLSENQPGILSQSLPYAPNSSPEEKVRPGASLGAGQHSINDLIRAMIVNDDDDAALTLFRHINKNSLNEIYSDLSIPYQENETTDDYLNIKAYSLFFRVLYNATYLNRASSERALALLSQGSSGQGFSAGLPNDLTVAHKTRARIMRSGAETLIEAHDCGIVYYPQHPYLLCVMGIGQRQDFLDTLFRDVGSAFEVDMRERYPNSASQTPPQAAGASTSAQALLDTPEP